MARTLIAFAAALALLVAACDGAPTESDIAPDLADLAKVTGLTPDDFDYRIIEMPEEFAALHTIIQKANIRGDLVGRYIIIDEEGRAAPRGFLLRKGTFETIHVEGALQTIAFGINERGTVVGTYMDADMKWHGFTYDRGTYTPFDAPVGMGQFSEETWIWDISTTGAVTGSFLDADGVYRGFVLNGNRFEKFLVPGAGFTEGFGINTRGEVTGHFAYVGDSRMFGFIYRKGEFTILDYPGEDDWMSCAMGIGIRGEAVGHVAGTYPGATYGYVWQDGQFSSLLRVPGAGGTFPTAIAPNGTIAGYANVGGRNVGFVATPR